MRLPVESCAGVSADHSAFYQSRNPRNLLLRDPFCIIRGSVEEALDCSSQGQLLGKLRRFLEIGAETFRLGEVVVAQAALDVELGVLLRERAHPLFDLAAAVFVAGTAFQIVKQRCDDAGKDLCALVFERFLGHGREC
jgi:hypothetical protein